MLSFLSWTNQAKATNEQQHQPSSTQTATLWQIIYYYGENIQTVNPAFHVFSSLFCPSQCSSAFHCVFANKFQMNSHDYDDDDWEERSERKAGKWSKSLRWKLLALKMSLWVMHFLYVRGWSPELRLAISFSIISMWFLILSRAQTFKCLQFLSAPLVSINNLEANGLFMRHEDVELAGGIWRRRVAKSIYIYVWLQFCNGYTLKSVLMSDGIWKLDFMALLCVNVWTEIARSVPFCRDTLRFVIGFRDSSKTILGSAMFVGYHQLIWLCKF